MVMSLFSGQLFAQNTPVNGKVVDDTGQPLIGATVKLKNGQGATTTDVDGKVFITAASRMR